MGPVTGSKDFTDADIEFISKIEHRQQQRLTRSLVVASCSFNLI